jgi:hypothetical protein
MMSDEKFFAWLDGELEGAEAADVEARVASDPELAALAAQHRAFGSQLKAAFDPLTSAPVPQPLRDAVRPPAEVIDLAARRERRTQAPIWRQAAALAACLAIGVAMGNMLVPGASSPIAPEAGRLVASAELEEALYTRLASASANEGPRIGLTFRDQSGRVCRSFVDQAASGLACHEGGDWRIRGLFQAPEGQSGDYRMAAGPDPKLMALVDETIAGEPFDAAQERAAKERGWR